MKWEIKEQLDEHPHFGQMFEQSFMVEAGKTHPFTPNESVAFTEDQRNRIDAGARLWAYAFVIYRDALGDGHQIGTIAKWDPKRGFIQVRRDNYSYQRDEKNY